MTTYEETRKAAQDKDSAERKAVVTSVVAARQYLEAGQREAARLTGGATMIPQASI